MALIIILLDRTAVDDLVISSLSHEKYSSTLNCALCP